MPIFDRIFRRGCVVLVVAVAAAGPVFALDGKPVEDHRSPLQAFREGAMALRSGNNKEAVSSLQYAADQGHLASAWKLGRMYADGDGVAQNDLKAFELFRKITSERADDSPNAPDARYVSNAFVALGNYGWKAFPAPM